jgi:hypothetical protein
MSWHAPTLQEGVARLPRRAPGRTLTLLRAWLHQLALDEALIAGADPWSHPELLLRATQLTSMENRRHLAEALESIGVGCRDRATRVALPRPPSSADP